MFCVMSAVELVGIKILWVHAKALKMRVRKLVSGLFLAQILPEKINKMLSSNNPEFIDVNRTVHNFQPSISEMRNLLSISLQFDY